MLANDAEYDRRVHDALPECGDVVFVTKDRATVRGRPGVCISFSVRLPDGSIGKVQAVMTGRNFAMVAAAFRGRYGVEGDRVTNDPTNN